MSSVDDAEDDDIDDNFDDSVDDNGDDNHNYHDHQIMSHATAPTLSS